MARRSVVGGGSPPPTDDPSLIDDHPARDDPEPDPESLARTICLRLLTARARSRQELAEALLRRNVPDEAADRVLDRLASVGLIDDHAFAVDFVRSKQVERGLASRELARQLRAKGIADETVAEVLADTDEAAERATARRLVERRLRSMGGLPPEVQTRRLAAMLARKGYSPGLTFQVVRQVVGESASEQVGADFEYPDADS